MLSRATVVAVGRVKGWAAEGCDDYLERLRRYFPVNVIEVPEEDFNRRSSKEVLTAEAGRIFKKLPDRAHVLVLDRERGRQRGSEELAQRLESIAQAGSSNVAFVLGGPLGLAPEILDRADEAWSFGPLTLPHALARVVLLEQLYRSVKIFRGEKYHW